VPQVPSEPDEDIPTSLGAAMTKSAGDRPGLTLDFESMLKSLRYIAMTHLDEKARVALEPRGSGVVFRVEWHGRFAEYEFDSRIYDLPHPRVAIEGRAQLLCADLARAQTKGSRIAQSATMQAVSPSAERAAQTAAAPPVARLPEAVKHSADRDPDPRPSPRDISRIEASVKRVLNDSIASATVVRIVIRADPTSGLPVRVLDGIPRGFKPAIDGRLRVVIEVIGGEVEQLVLLDRISMVSQAPT
jgi:hypothetical protein